MDILYVWIGFCALMLVMSVRLFQRRRSNRNTKNSRSKVVWTLGALLISSVGMISGFTPDQESLLTSISPLDRSTYATTKSSLNDTSDDSYIELAPGKLAVHYIDVGQGASQLIISPSGRIMLIDGGHNDDEARIVQYLKNHGVTRVDILIGTHPDADHVGGLDAVVDAFDIGEIYMPDILATTKTFESVLDAIERKQVQVKTAQAGIILAFDENITAEIIAPRQMYKDRNEMSAVVRLTYGQSTFLFTGDAEAASESDMRQSQENLRSDVLLIGHHGSLSSTSELFLQAVQPQFAIIQVGTNKYGHPHPTVVERLTAAGATIYRNDRDGHITAISDGEIIELRTQRSKLR